MSATHIIEEGKEMLLVTLQSDYFVLTVFFFLFVFYFFTCGLYVLHL